MTLFVQVHQDTEPDAESTLRFDEYRSADSKLYVTLLGQAMTDDVLRVNKERSCAAAQGFQQTKSGGCFKQGSNGKFVKKKLTIAISRPRQPPERLQPAYGQPSDDNPRPFRPKVSVTDLKRSVSHLQNSLQTEREKHGQAQIRCCALESEVKLFESPEAREHVKRLSASLESERQEVATIKSTAQQLRRERDAARSQVLLSESALSAQADEHKCATAQMQFEHSAEMDDLKGSVQRAANAAIAEAHTDKEEGIAKAQLQVKKYRQNWTKAHVQKSRLQTKLHKTVEQFEMKAAAVKGRNRKDVKGLLTELQVLVSSSEGDRKRSDALQAKLNTAIHQMQEQLSEATGSIRTMKNKRDFSDEIVLLTWELMAMGVSSNIVGDVEALCCEHLAHRKLERKPSKSTAGRWSIQSKDITMHHLGEMLSKNAERGIGYATDTTTVRSAERAANNFEIRLEDNSVLKLRGPVNELASHTADEQMKHNIEYILSDARRVMETAAVLGNSGRVSVAYFVTVMGDHVNEALWDRVEAAKFVELDRLIREEAISSEVAAQMRMFIRTKCSKHKLAKLSRDACNAMVALQDPAIAAFTNMVGKTGRTYESLGYKLVEVVSWQFSCDISVANPHGHSQDFTDWQHMMEQDPLAIPNTNKNRHYRHEKNARKVLIQANNILQYLGDVRDGRDEKEHPNKETKLGNADSRIWKALHPQYTHKHKLEAYAQMAAMDMLHALFYAPALCMICAPSTDVVNVGEQWRAAYDYLTKTVPSKTAEELMCGGKANRCFAAYHKKDKTQAQLKTVDELEFNTPILPLLEQFNSDGFKSRSIEYFRVAAKRMAASILEIAPEYFPAVYQGIVVQKEDGQLYNPSLDVAKALAGFICENDFCEQQLGDERKMLTSSDGKISMDAVSGLNMMRHNQVIADIRSGRVVNIVGLRGKLAKERRAKEGSVKDRRVKMRTRVEAYKSHKRKEVMQRAQNRAAARAVTEAVNQFLKRSDVEAVLSPQNKAKVDEKVKIVKDQLKIYRDLLGMGMKAVPMSHSVQVPAPGGRIKKKKLTGNELLQWLCGNLLKLMGKAEGDHGAVTPWRETVAANPNCGSVMVLQGVVAAHNSTSSQAFVEECEEPESDTDVATTESAQTEVFAAEEVAPPDFEELEANEEGESDEEYEPKVILDSRGESRRIEYLIHWKGYSKSEATWEPKSHIASCKQVIKAWESKQTKGGGTKKVCKRKAPSTINNKSKKKKKKK